jgi:RHS repeat-associated protein
MSHSKNLKVSLITAIISAGLIQNAIAASTMVTDAVGTQELWEFQEILGAQKLTSKINQVDGKGITQTWDANGNKLTRTDAEGRVMSYTYNATNQRTTMTEAVGTPQERVTSYEYVSADVDLITKTSSPSIYSGNIKETINTYDANLNIVSVVINGFNAQGSVVSRAIAMAYDSYGKVTQINAARTDVNDITTLEYYDCNTGAECGQLKTVTNPLGHTRTYDSYDAAARLLQSTDSNGTVTTYTYHPRSWLLSMTQTPITGDARVTNYDYDNVGQLIKVTLPDATEQNYVYDAAHDLREVSDNLGNKVEYTYDAKGNRTQELASDPDGTLVRSTITTYDIRNFVESINSGGSITQLINDAVGNLSTQTDPNQNPDTSHSFDALDRLTNTVDALTNDSTYQYNVADQLDQVVAPNGAVTSYEYDDLGNQTKEESSDRGALIYTHDDAGNVISITDDRGITVSYQYDELNRVTSSTYPSASENISYLYDAVDCGASIGRLCQFIDETGQTNYEYDSWGNILAQTKQELGVSYTTLYQYDAQNRVVQMTYPNGRVVNYQRDAIGRIDTVTTTINGITSNVISNRTYRADNTVTGHVLGNGLIDTRSYDLQGRVTQINAGSLESWGYSYDANSNVTQITKPIEGRGYTYDGLDRIIGGSKSQVTDTVKNYSYEYDANGNRTKRNNRVYDYATNTNLLIKDGNKNIIRDTVGNTLDTLQDRTFTYSDSNRLRTVSRGGVVKAKHYYNALSQRTQKERPDKNTHVYHYDLTGNLILRTIQNGRAREDYVWVDNELKQYARLNGKTNAERTKTFITTDHLATPRIGTSDDQTITWRWDSDAFNRKRPNNNPDGDTEKVNLKIGFAGQYWDSESKLYYNWNRYYDPKSGRYVTSDPIGLGGGLNTYGYVGGNPLRYSDPRGEQAVESLGGFCAANPAVCGAGGALSSGVLACGVGLGALLFPSNIASGTCSDNPGACDAGGDVLESRGDRAPGFWPGDSGAREWDRQNGGGRKGRDKFHELKGRDRGPASGARDDTSVNPDTGEVRDGNGEEIGNLNE